MVRATLYAGKWNIVITYIYLTIYIYRLWDGERKHRLKM